MSVQTLKDERIFFFSTSKKNPARQIIPAIDEIIVEEEIDGTKKLRKKVIRYLIGDPTIYPDLPVDELKKNPGSKIVFQNGVLGVSSFEINQLEFLRKSNYNLSNPLRDKTKPALFRENIKGEDALKYIDESKSKTYAEYKIHEMSAMQIELMAYAIGWNHVGSTLNADLKRDLLVFTQKNHKLINQLIDNFAETERKALINKAFEVGKLVIQGDSVAWDTGQGILNVGYGKNFKEELYLFLSSPNGKQVYDALYAQMSPTEKIAKQNFVQPVAEPKPETTDKAVEVINTFNTALKLGILSLEGSDIYLIDKPKNMLLGSSTKEVIAKMSDDAMLLSKIDRKIEKAEK